MWSKIKVKNINFRLIILRTRLNTLTAAVFRNPFIKVIVDFTIDNCEEICVN